MSLGYDLYVIDPENKDTTPEQLRDCIHDALDRISERLTAIENKLGFDDISLCDKCYCMTHTINGICGKCGANKA